MSVLERLEASRLNYWGGFALDVALSTTTLVYGCAHAGAAAAFAVAAGVAEYTLLEYVFHRWLYHTRANPLAHLHRIHHARPGRMLGAPFFFAPAVGLVHALAATLVCAPILAATFAATVLACYAAQSAIHHVAHGWTGTRVLDGPLVRRWRRHHMLHHRDGRSNFGIVTALWDDLLGTRALRLGHEHRSRAVRSRARPS